MPAALELARVQGRRRGGEQGKASRPHLRGRGSSAMAEAASGPIQWSAHSDCGSSGGGGSANRLVSTVTGHLILGCSCDMYMYVMCACTCACACWMYLVTCVNMLNMHMCMCF